MKDSPGVRAWLALDASQRGIVIADLLVNLEACAKEADRAATIAAAVGVDASDVAVVIERTRAAHHAALVLLIECAGWTEAEG